MMELKLLTLEDEAIIKIFNEWRVNEKEHEKYTCRPLKSHENYSSYKKAMIDLLKKDIKAYYLTDGQHVLGKITFFDYNPRNCSGEFGYYMPKIYRGLGYGSKMMTLFINTIFKDEKLKLNKLCATTSSGNLASNKLLQKFKY